MPDATLLLLVLLLGQVAVDFLLPLRRQVQQAHPLPWRAPSLYGLAFAQGLAVLLVLVLLRENPALAATAAFFTVLIRLLLGGWAAARNTVAARHVLLEQGMQWLLLVAIWLTSEGMWTQLPGYLAELVTTRNLLILLAYLLVLIPASTLIGALMKPWQEKLDQDDSLVNGGAFVGYLERGLILTFVLLGRWEAIGFLLTAKSILRFSELKGRHQQPRSEYVLLGTLLSFSLSIGVGLAVRLILA